MPTHQKQSSAQSRTRRFTSFSTTPVHLMFSPVELARSLLRQKSFGQIKLLLETANFHNALDILQLHNPNHNISRWAENTRTVVNLANHLVTAWHNGRVVAYFAFK